MGNSMPPARNSQINRAHVTPARADRVRVRIDRLRPGGVKKKNVALDRREKGLAPSPAQSVWFGHGLVRQGQSRERCTDEVHEHPHPLRQLRVLARRGSLTLIHLLNDEAHNDAVVLRELVLGRPLRSRFKASNSRNRSSVFAGSSCSAGDFDTHRRELSDTTPTTA